MSDPQQNEPTEDDLVAFAAELLGDVGRSLENQQLLRETVLQARELWTQLYQVTKST